MLVKRQEMEPTNEIMYSTVDECEPTTDFCLANIGEDVAHYLSCGERLRRRKNGVKLCPTHGEMY